MTSDVPVATDGPAGASSDLWARRVGGSLRSSAVWSALTSTTGLTVLIGLVAGLVFIALNPPYWGNDGMSQFARTFQVAHGRFAPLEIDWGEKGRSFGGDIPTSFWHLYEHAGTDLGQNPAEPAPMVLEPDTYRSLEGQPTTGVGMSTVWFTNTAAYSPVPYLPGAVAERAAEVLGLDVGGTLRLMATADLLSYLVCIGLAVFVLRASQTRWLMLVLALLPPALLQVSTVTADSLTNGLALLFAALVGKAVFLRQRLARWEAALAVVAAVALPLCKPSYLFLSVLLVVVPLPFLRGHAARWLKVAVIAVAVLLWGAWTAISGPTADSLAFYRADYMTSTFGTAAQIQYTLGHLGPFLGDLARTLFYRDNFYFLDLIGSSNVRVPDTAMALSYVALFLGFGIIEVYRPFRRALVVTVVVCAVSIAAVFGTLYLTFTPVGYYLVDGVQGRYFFPLLPFCLVSLGALVRLRLVRRAPASDGHAEGLAPGYPSRVGAAIVILVGLALLLTLIKFWYVVWGA